MFLNKRNYFKELDSLRGISIIMVFLYHLKIKFQGIRLFESGFLGVDIFFAISGYLITYLIILEIKRKKFFDFKAFIERRCRRIFPSVFLMIFTVSIISIVFLYSNQLYQTIYHSIFSLFFVENFYLIQNNSSYWNGVNDLNFNPLIHMWALSIEVQFYLFIGLFFLYFKKIEIFFKFAISIILFFLILNVFISVKFPLESFYLFPFRLPEFVIGGLFAFLSLSNKPIFSKIAARLIYFSSILIVIAIIIKVEILKYLNLNFYHPSIYTFLLVFCIGAIILSHKYQTKSIKKYLENNTLSLVGKYSYSIYIWHFPIIFFYDFFIKILSLKDYLLITIITFFVSYLSFNLFEKFMRNRKLIKSNIFFLIISIIFISIVIINIFSHFKINQKTIMHNNKSIYLNLNEIKEIDKAIIVDSNYYVSEWQNIRSKYNLNFDKEISKNNLLFIGNSVGRDYYFAFRMFNKIENKFSAKYFNPNNSNFQVRCLKNFLKNNKDCKNKFVNQNYREMFDYSEVIVLSTKWSYDDLDILEELIKDLKNDNKKIVLVNHPPMFKTKKENYKIITILDDYLMTKKKFTLTDNEELIIQKKFYDNQMDLLKVKDINSKLNFLSKKYNLIYLDAYSNICSELKKTCHIKFDRNKKLMYDYLHLTYDGTNFVGKKLFKSFKIN